MPSTTSFVTFEIDADLAAQLDVCQVRRDRPALWLGSTSGDPQRYADRVIAGDAGPQELRRPGALTQRRDIHGRWRPTPKRSEALRRRRVINKLYRRGYTLHRRQQHRVYVGRLDGERSRRQRVYVGSTSKPVEVRWHEHLSGATTEEGRRLASRTVERLGGELAPDIGDGIMRQLPPFATKGDGLEAERQVAHALSLLGFHVDGDGTSEPPIGDRHVCRLGLSLDDLLAEHDRLSG